MRFEFSISSSAGRGRRAGGGGAVTGLSLASPAKTVLCEGNRASYLPRRYDDRHRCTKRMPEVSLYYYARKAKRARLGHSRNHHYGRFYIFKQNKYYNVTLRHRYDFEDDNNSFVFSGSLKTIYTSL